MKAIAIQDGKPIVSLIIILLSLFFIVFFKMEVRRLSYSVLKSAKTYRNLHDDLVFKEIKLSRMTGHQRVNELAHKLTLSEARVGQIIQLTGKSIAVPQ
ncbi:MAG: histidine kinase [Bdellovibrionaceae bacterium]|nr:histidine kinase [Pseudobdellovibrionaceae bacterium]